LKKALKKQHITVNDSIASSATFINGGEIIRFSIPKEAKPKKALIFPLKVLFEDEHLAMIHKPPGILVSGNSFKTIAHALAQNLKPSKLVDATTPKPVHRLDYATTGILLVGKTSSGIQALNKMFENKEIKKTYYAITMGEMDSKRQITLSIENKTAQSNYSISESVPSKRFDKLNLVKLTPLTGRRHQLRKHLSHIGNPILGDKDAYSLEFEHPFTSAKIHVTDELPKRFKKIFPRAK